MKRIVFAIFIGSWLGIPFILVGIFCCCGCFTGPKLQENLVFVNTKNSKQSKKELDDVNVFQSGIWSSRYFQYNNWHGPHEFTLSFDPQSMKVTGSRSDNVGTFTIDGLYSYQTRRIGLTKQYQAGIGNPCQNLGHQMIIQLK